MADRDKSLNSDIYYEHFLAKVGLYVKKTCCNKPFTLFITLTNVNGENKIEI